METKLKIIISFIVPSLLFIIFSIPLVMKKIPRNGAYGFRTAKTSTDDEVWYKANTFGGTALLVAALISFLGCTVLLLNRENLSADIINTLGFILFVVPIVVSILISLVYIKKL